MHTRCFGVVGDGKHFCTKNESDCLVASHRMKKLEDSILTENGNLLALKINESKSLTDSIWPVYSLTDNAIKYLLEQNFTVDNWIFLYNKLTVLRNEKGLDSELTYLEVFSAVAKLRSLDVFNFDHLSSSKVSIDTKEGLTSPAMSFKRIDSFVPDVSDSKYDPEDMVALLARIEKIEKYLASLVPSISDQLEEAKTHALE